MKKLMIGMLVLLLSGCMSNAEEPAKELDMPKEPEIQIEEAVETETDDVQGVYLNQDKAIGDTSPVTRGMCAKMIAIAFNDKNTIDSMEREITFTDTDESKWYDKYINIVYIQGFMLGTGNDQFLPEEPITIEQAQRLMDVIDENNRIKIEISDESKEKPISFALWTELLTKTLENMSGEKTMAEVFGIEERTILPLATRKNNDQLSAYHMITDVGPMSLVGLSLDNYIDKEIAVLVKGDEILSLLSVVTDTPTIRNVYISHATNDEISIFTGGVERTYFYDNASSRLKGEVANVTIHEDKAIQVDVFTEKISGIIKKVEQGTIELDSGLYQNDEHIKVYGVTTDTVRWRRLSHLIVGSSIAEYIIADNKIVACLIRREANLDTIRVAIHTTGHNGLIHDSVSFTGTTDYNIVINDEIREMKAWESFSVDKDLLGQQRIYVYTNDPEGRIALTSISRNWGNSESPKYRGIIEIGKTQNGLSIVNELPFEEYLFAVVPSEMPTSHGLEAAKVQAVTARSYAYNQYFANRYRRYGANVDDSVSSQVYNNIPENATSIQAVSETEGLCLLYNGSVISANFFSTSSGMTANSGEVWANSATAQFPTVTPSYLTATKQYTGADFGDLRIEENAYRFFKETEIDSYDKDFNWFRWNVDMTAEEIAASINANIATRYSASPQMIKTLQEGNRYRSRPIETIGTLKDIEVIERGEGGNILRLKVIGSEAEIVIATEYNIRMLIKPSNILERDIILNRSDGSKLQNYSLMPSGFFVMDKQYDDNNNIKSITFYGGGNGHGAGMSQNGVKGMIDQGFDFEEILMHYYSGTEIKKML